MEVQRVWSVKQLDEEFHRVAVLLACGAEDAHEHALGLGAGVRAAAAGGLAVDHGGTDGLLGRPVGGLDIGIVEEGEERWPLAGQVAGERPRNA